MAGSVDKVTTILEAKDHITGVLDRVTAKAGSANTALGKVQGALGWFKQGAAIAGIGIVAAALMGLTLIIGKVLEGLRQAAHLMVGFIGQSVMMGARVESLSIALDMLAKSSGYGRKALQDLVSVVQAGGIAKIEALQGVLAGITAGISPEDIKKLSAAARDVARGVPGMTSSEAFQRFVESVGTQQMQLLNVLRMPANLDELMRRYAEANGIKTTDIATGDRAKLITDYILSEAKKVSGAYDAAQKTFAGQLSSHPRYVQDLQTTLGSLVTPNLYKPMKFVNDFLKALKESVAEGKGLARLFQFVGSVIDGVTQFFGSGEAAAKRFNMWLEKMFDPARMQTILTWFANIAKLLVVWEASIEAAWALLRHGDFGAVRQIGEKTADRTGAIDEMVNNTMRAYTDWRNKKPEVTLPDEATSRLDKIAAATAETAENTRDDKFDTILGGSSRLKAAAAATAMRGGARTIQVAIKVMGGSGEHQAIAGQAASAAASQILGQLGSGLGAQVGY